MRTQNSALVEQVRATRSDLDKSIANNKTLEILLKQKQEEATVYKRGFDDSQATVIAQKQKLGILEFDCKAQYLLIHQGTSLTECTQLNIIAFTK